MEPWLTGFTCANLSTDDLTWRTVSGDDNRWKNRVFRPDAAAIDDTASQAGRQGFESPRPLLTSTFSPKADTLTFRRSEVRPGGPRRVVPVLLTDPQRPHDASQDAPYPQVPPLQAQGFRRRPDRWPGPLPGQVRQPREPRTLPAAHRRMALRR